MQIRSGLRPWTFSASLIPVALGAVLSYKYTAVFNGTSAIILLLSVAAVVAVNSAGNMVNTYFDYMRSMKLRAGGDERSGRPRRNTSTKSMHLAGLFFGGLSSSFIYTGGIGVKYYVLGDLLVIFTFGPLALLFSFVSQTGKLTFITAVASPSRWPSSLRPYLVFFIWGLQYSLPLALPVLTIPFSFQLEKVFREGAPRTLGYRTGTAKLNLAMGLLFVVGWCA
eukprot:Em0581g1a